MDFTPVILPFVNEALKVLGLWAAAPLLAGFAAWEIRRKLMAKDAEIAALRAQNEALQEKRLQDAREMIRIAESGTAATAARTQSDQRFADLLEALLRKTNGPNLLGWRR
jgi:hypothetical protein